MEGTLRAATGKAMEDLGTTIQEGKDILEASAADPGEKSRQFRQKLETGIENAKALYERLADQTSASAKATDKAVHEHPYQAVGIAFGVGLLIGVLAGRSRRD